MRKGIYVHPWDIFDEGEYNVLCQLQDIGLNTINIASSYHQGRFLLPHNPIRKIINAEEGVVYFDFNQDYFKNTCLKPEKSKSFKNKDVLKILVEANQSFNLDLTSWTVFFHNGRLATKHRNLAVKDPFGTVDPNNLCPNSGDARNYASGLIRNISENYGIRHIQMESVFYPRGLYHGSHHEIFGVNTNPTVDFLFSLCYCKRCLQTAAEKKIKMSESIPKIKKYINNSFSDESNIKYSNSKKEIIEELQKLNMEFLIEFKKDTYLDIITQISESIEENSSKAIIEIISNSEIDYEGISYGELPDAIKGIDLLEYYSNSEQIIEKFKEVSHLLNRRIKLFPSVRINYPLVKNQLQLTDVINTVNNLSKDGFNLYNYGWTNKDNFKTLKTYFSN